MLLVDIPPLHPLGHLPGLADWTIARRTWLTDGVLHHQFVATHPQHWCYEYRCTDSRQYVAHYWCCKPLSVVLEVAVAIAVMLLIEDEWEWMSSRQSEPEAKDE